MKFQPEKIAMKEAALRNLACQECGQGIEADAMFCKHCHAPIVRRYCAGCSQLVPQNSAFCPFCGTSASAPMPDRFGLVTKIAPVALGLLMLVIFIGREDRMSQRATSRTPVETELSAGSGGQGFSAPLKQDVKATLTASATTQDVAEDGRRLNEEAHDLMLQKKFAEAIPLLQQSIHAFGPGSKDEGYPFALFNLAQSFRMSGKPEKGLPILENLVKTHADNSLFQHELATTRNALAQQPQATAADATVN